MTNHAIKQCYWVESSTFLAGEYPGDKDDRIARERIAALLKAGVSAFIDLTERRDGLEPYAQFLDAGQAPNAHGITYHHFPIRDYSVPASPAVTAAILDTIDGHIAQGRTVYVHCWGGVGRTGLVVSCWLATRRGHGDAAPGVFQELWTQCPKSSYRRAPESREQRAYVRNWTEDA